jgi:hypothetical protein
MPRSSPAAKPASKPTVAPVPSPRVVKLQILAGVFVPMLALGLWLRSKGFW